MLHSCIYSCGGMAIIICSGHATVMSQQFLSLVLSYALLDVLRGLAGFLTNLKVKFTMSINVS